MNYYNLPRYIYIYTLYYIYQCENTHTYWIYTSAGVITKPAGLGCRWSSSGPRRKSATARKSTGARPRAPDDESSKNAYQQGGLSSLSASVWIHRDSYIMLYIIYICLYIYISLWMQIQSELSGEHPKSNTKYLPGATGSIWWSAQSFVPKIGLSYFKKHEAKEKQVMWGKQCHKPPIWEW